MLSWLKYSGMSVIITVNPYHWRLGCKYVALNEVWETDHLLLELLPITIRVWFDNGDW